MNSKKSVWMSLVMVAVVSLSLVVPAAAFAEEPVHIIFVADRTHLQAGQCAMLEWHVEGDFWVELNGLHVSHAGHNQVCPPYTKPFTLMVDLGDRVEIREIVIHVEGANQPPSPPEPLPQPPAPQAPPAQKGVTIGFRADRVQINAGECTMLRWDVEHAQEVYLNGKGVIGHSARTVCPNSTKTFALQVIHAAGTTDRKITIKVAGGGAPAKPQQGKRAADLAVTDLYPKKMPQGKVWVRVTNNGPATLKKVQIELKCNAFGHPLGGQQPWSHVESPWLHTVSLKPGQTATFPTKIAINTSKYSYDVTCAVSAPAHGVTFFDPNSANNGFSKKIAAKGQGKPGFSADLAVTDLYPQKLRNGKLFARISNHGPGTLNNVQVRLSCQGGAWKGSQVTTISKDKMVKLNLKPGQTSAFDTGIVINIDHYDSYEMTCKVQAGFDPNPGNNAFSELIP